jgi:hypothetical protein
MIVTKPIQGTILIPATIKPYPNTFVVIAIIASVTLFIKDTFFAFACFLAAVWRCLRTVLLIAASFFAPIYITILVLRA